MSQIEWPLEFHRIRMQIEIPLRSGIGGSEFSADDVQPWYEALSRYSSSEDLPPSGELMAVIQGAMWSIAVEARHSTNHRDLLNIVDSMGYELQRLFDPFYPGTAFDQLISQSWWPTPGQTVLSLIGTMGRAKSLNSVVLISHTEQADDWTSTLALDWPTEFTLEGRRYASVSDFLQEAQGAMVELLTEGPRTKEERNQLFGLNDWILHRSRLASRAYSAKISQDKRLEEVLISTGESVIVNADPADNIWGIGLAAADPRVLSPALWRGENLLGFVLMQLRDQLTKNQPESPVKG